MNVLVVEDQVSMVIIHRLALTSAGHKVIVARDGVEARAHFARETFGAVITDWMMPNENGLDLIRWIRANVRPIPLIVMVTSLGLPDAIAQAFEAGADEYLVKPVIQQDIIAALQNAERKRSQKVGRSLIDGAAVAHAATKRFAGVVVAAGSGSGAALRRILKSVQPTSAAAFFVVVHSPAWALKALAEQLAREISAPIMLATGGMEFTSGAIYIAPGDSHMIVDQSRQVLHLQNSEPENFVRPSADPLMRSVAAAFGASAVGILLGGAGCDATIGAGYIHTVGGKVLALNPQDTVVPQMVESVIDLRLVDEVLSLDALVQRVRTCCDPRD